MPSKQKEIENICFDQGELNMHRIVVTVLRRLRPPFSKTGICRFPVPEIPLFLWEVLLFTQNLEHESTVFPPPQGNGGQNVARNGGPQIGACLILSDLKPFGFAERFPSQGFRRQGIPKTG